MNELFADHFSRQFYLQHIRLVYFPVGPAHGKLEKNRARNHFGDLQLLYFRSYFELDHWLYFGDPELYCEVDAPPLDFLDFETSLHRLIKPFPPTKHFLHPTLSK